ncbi:MAG: hypothetical protein QOG20_5184 [Pseudonocardiales bacterium]|jgi:nucleotide-binding universal stress UspA family protein|nr:hypothetical protein [Pseudonocardiales bacterium]
MDVPHDRRPIVVGVDRSASARDAALWAADIAAARGHPLQVVHTTTGPVGVPPAWLNDIVEAACAIGARPTTVDIVRGKVLEVLLRRSRRALLVVVGSYGAEAARGLQVGSTALGLTAQAPCSVAVVRGSEAGRPAPRSGPIVVGVDGTSTSAHALGLAADLAAALRARLVAVHTWSDIAVDDAGGMHRTDASWSELADDAARVLDEQLTAVANRHSGLGVERQIVGDSPLRALLELAPTARMVIVGQREHPPAGGMSLGSTSRGLVEFAPCPVLISRPSTSSGTAEASVKSLGAST